MPPINAMDNERLQFIFALCPYKGINVPAHSHCGQQWVAHPLKTCRAHLCYIQQAWCYHTWLLTTNSTVIDHLNIWKSSSWDIFQWRWISFSMWANIYEFRWQVRKVIQCTILQNLQHLYKFQPAKQHMQAYWQFHVMYNIMALLPQSYRELTGAQT